MPYAELKGCMHEPDKCKTASFQYKMLSYRRETALQGTLVLAESGRLELRDDILLIL